MTLPRGASLIIGRHNFFSWVTAAIILLRSVVTAGLAAPRT
jgi:hypothetical protein